MPGIAAYGVADPCAGRPPPTSQLVQLVQELATVETPVTGDGEGVKQAIQALLETTASRKCRRARADVPPASNAEPAASAAAAHTGRKAHGYLRLWILSCKSRMGCTPSRRSSRTTARERPPHLDFRAGIWRQSWNLYREMGCRVRHAQPRPVLLCHQPERTTGLAMTPSRWVWRGTDAHAGAVSYSDPVANQH